ncbi:MAG TPA: hypothetical protein VIV60_02265 [Polyangiaceae bacterium]
MSKTILASLAVGCVAALYSTQSYAFRACEDYNVSATLEGDWPDYNSSDKPVGSVPGANGTHRWSFHYKYNNEGLELNDVMYGSDPANRRLVARKISLPYLMTRYPQPSDTTNPSPNPTTCGGTAGPAFVDTPIAARTTGSGATFHCAHVPTTVCDLGVRSCNLTTHTCVGEDPALVTCSSDADCFQHPRSGVLNDADCVGSCVTCNGICAGTQVEKTSNVEIGGDNETVSGGSDADIVLTTMNYYGGYQFQQRYRFKHDGRLVSSFRFGGLYQLQWHNHIAYWRFELDPASNSGNDVAQRCDSGTCGLGPSGWVTRGCECEKTNTTATPHGMWRFFDQSEDSAGTPSRAIVIRGSANDGDPTVCANTDKSYCLLRTNADVNEGLAPNPSQCLDGLNDYVSSGCGGGLAAPGPISFWYLGHFNGHNPCAADEQAFCDPADGFQAMGPILSLVGSW